MNSLERTMKVMTGELPDRVPVALHNFLMAARMAGIPLNDCLQDGDLLAESQIYAWKQFGHDVLLVENGTTAMAEAFGCKVQFIEDTAPRISDPFVKDFADIDRLKLTDPDKSPMTSQVLKAVRRLRKELGDEVFIMGRADQAPLALTACLRGHETFLYDLAEEENFPAIEQIADICLEATIRYSLALRDAGAHGTCIGEHGSDQISPATYRRLIVPRLKKYFAAMREAGFPAGVHQCGNTVAVLDDMAASGAWFLEMDPITDSRAAKEASRGKVAVLGMVDPATVLHLGTPEMAAEKTREALDILAPGGGFIVGPGCAVAAQVPEENIAALIETAHRYGRYNPDGTLAA